MVLAQSAKRDKSMVLMAVSLSEKRAAVYKYWPSAARDGQIF
jgi:hypothetical protein